MQRGTRFRLIYTPYWNKQIDMCVDMVYTFLFYLLNFGKSISSIQATEAISEDSVPTFYLRILDKHLQQPFNNQTMT